MNEQQEKEARFIAAVKRELDHGAATLDSLTLARLRAARRRALDARPQSRGWRVAGGLATTALGAALVAVLLWVPAPTLAPPLAGLDQFDLLGETDSLELYGDLEFYRWLAARADAA